MSVEVPWGFVVKYNDGECKGEASSIKNTFLHFPYSFRNGRFQGIY